MTWTTAPARLKVSDVYPDEVIEEAIKAKRTRNEGFAHVVDCSIVRRLKLVEREGKIEVL